MELKAKPNCCEEASLASRSFYIPCNRPATTVIYSKGDQREYRMCEMCADHNLMHRGARFVRRYEQTVS